MFGVDVIFRTITNFRVYCIVRYRSILYFESPNEIIADGVVLTTDYAVVVKTSDFSAVVSNDSMTVDGVAYTVREPMLLDDGKIMRIMLMKT